MRTSVVASALGVRAPFGKLITPIPVSKETQLERLDGPERACLGYPDLVIKGHALDA